MLKNRGIDIECCQDCQLHQSIVRHNQQNYLQLVNQLRRQLQQHGMQLIKNRLPNYLVKQNTKSQGLPSTISVYRCCITQKLRLFPRVGSFEIRYGKLLLYSKLQVEELPTVRDIMTLLFFVAKEEKEDMNLIKMQKYNEEKIMVDGGNCLYKDIFQFKERFLRSVESKKENIVKRVQSVKKNKKISEKKIEKKVQPDTERAVLTPLVQNEETSQQSQPRTFRRHCTLIYRLESFANGEPLVPMQPSQFAQMTKNLIQDDEFSLNDMPILPTRKKITQQFGTSAKIAPLTRQNSRHSIVDQNQESNRYFLTKQEDVSVDQNDEIPIEDEKFDAIIEAKKLLTRTVKQPQAPKTTFNLPILSSKSIEQPTKKTIIINTNSSIQHKSSRIIHPIIKETPQIHQNTHNHSSSFGQPKNQPVNKSLRLAVGHRINVHKAPRPSQEQQTIERRQMRLPTHTSQRADEESSRSSVSHIQHIKLTLNIEHDQEISRPETSSRKKRSNLTQTVNTYLKHLSSAAILIYLKSEQPVEEQPTAIQPKQPQAPQQSQSSSQLIEQPQNHSMIREVSQHRECDSDSDEEDTRPTSNHFSKNPTSHSANIMKIFQMPEISCPIQMKIEHSDDAIPMKMQNVLKILKILNYPLKNVMKCSNSYEVWLKDPLWQPIIVQSNCEIQEILTKVISRNIEITNIATLINIISGCPALQVSMTDKKQIQKIIQNFEKDKRQASIFVIKNNNIYQVADIETSDGISSRLFTLQMQKGKKICMLQPDLIRHFQSLLLVHCHPDYTFSQTVVSKGQNTVQFRVVSELQQNSNCYIQINPKNDEKIHSTVQKIQRTKRQTVGSVTRKGPYYFGLKLENEGKYVLNMKGQFSQATITFYSLGRVRILQRENQGQRLSTFGRMMPTKDIDDSAPDSDGQL